jgi:type IV pilus biogenesis protein CpaD/CtpE
MKRILIAAVAAALAGCAGLQTQWVIHMEYQTPAEARK